MLGDKQYRLAKRMRWAARIIGLLAAGFCLFMLIGCNATDKEKIDSEKPGKDIPEPIFEEVENSQPPSDKPAEKKEDEKMEYEARELLKGFGPPSANQKLPRLTIFRTQAAWEKYKKAHEQENENLADVSADWKVSVVLLIELKPTGGMEASPYISSLTRTGNIVDLAVDWKIDPDVPMLDVELQPWLISEAPADAFAGDPEVNFMVKNSGQGEVFYEQ